MRGGRGGVHAAVSRGRQEEQRRASHVVCNRRPAAPSPGDAPPPLLPALPCRRHGPGNLRHGHARHCQAGRLQSGEAPPAAAAAAAAIPAVDGAAGVGTGGGRGSQQQQAWGPFCPARSRPPLHLPLARLPAAGAGQRRGAARGRRLCGCQLPGHQQQGRVGHQALQPAGGGVQVRAWEEGGAARVG